MQMPHIPNKDDASRCIINVSIPTQSRSQNQMITVNFENLNSLRLIKVKASFEVDQGKCKWDLDLYQVQRIVLVPS